MDHRTTPPTSEATSNGQPTRKPRKPRVKHNGKASQGPKPGAARQDAGQATQGQEAHPADAPLPTAEAVPAAVEQPEFSTRPLSHFEPRKPDYLWTNWLVRGAVHTLEGDPGVGKTTLAVALIAKLTRGDKWPDKSKAPKVPVAVLSLEDDPHQALRPRVDAAGGDPAMVHFLTWKGGNRPEDRPRFPLDAESVCVAIKRIGAKLFVVSNPGTFLEEGMTMNNSENVLAAFGSFEWIARETGAAVLVVRHHNKASGQKAVHRGAGSVSAAGVARIILAATLRPGSKDRGVLAVVKTNDGVTPTPLAYRVVGRKGAPVIEWEGKYEKPFEKLLGAPQEEGKRAQDEAAERFLMTELADGYLYSKELLAKAREAGIGERPIWDAKANLGCDTRQRKVGNKRRWEWGPPKGGWAPLKKSVSQSVSQSVSGGEGALATPPAQVQTD